MNEDNLFGAVIGLLAGGAVTFSGFLVLISVYRHEGVELFPFAIIAVPIGFCVGGLLGPWLFERSDGKR